MRASIPFIQKWKILFNVYVLGVLLALAQKELWQSQKQDQSIIRLTFQSYKNRISTKKASKIKKPQINILNGDTQKVASQTSIKRALSKNLSPAHPISAKMAPNIRVMMLFCKSFISIFNPMFKPNLLRSILQALSRICKSTFQFLSSLTDAYRQLKKEEERELENFKRNNQPNH